MYIYIYIFNFYSLIVKYKLNNTNDERQFDAIKYGFYEIVPRNLNSIFSELDLKVIIFTIIVLYYQYTYILYCNFY